MERQWTQVRRCSCAPSESVSSEKPVIDDARFKSMALPGDRSQNILYNPETRSESMCHACVVAVCCSPCLQCPCSHAPVCWVKARRTQLTVPPARRVSAHSTLHFMSPPLAGSLRSYICLKHHGGSRGSTTPGQLVSP